MKAWRVNLYAVFRKHANRRILISPTALNIFYSSSDNLRKAAEQFDDYIKEETLAVMLDGENIPDRLPNMSDEFEGES